MSVGMVSCCYGISSQSAPSYVRPCGTLKESKEAPVDLINMLGEAIAIAGQGQLISDTRKSGLASRGMPYSAS